MDQDHADPIPATPMRILVAIPRDFDSEFATNVLKSLIADVGLRSLHCGPSVDPLPAAGVSPRQCVTQAPPAWPLYL